MLERMKGKGQQKIIVEKMNIEAGGKAAVVVYEEVLRKRVTFLYHGEHKTDFEHPGCGGTFYEKADNVRLNCKSESRFYKPNGVFIESYFED